ncbi:uncharacterized protein M421DRAFT_200 [Didymella exigua CBS 183.55]|uniref:Uncharacterized protein n=1 Tax=Didymella exigua CBS 183.55 TaxID=1150837 RepID=A0A6A5S6B5_9PLEO|nr:uncharacterized protein M421DRAFT_200 [Didymella exigua CBS 183.55]KAF1934036.1 hypothetical protein M421DRAFT_200 [Didymella exigua CBS 183.55]
MLKPIESELQPFNFEEVLAADRAAGSRNIHIDVSRNSKGVAVPSLERLKRKVQRCLTNDTKYRLTTTKLYISGDWNYAGPEDTLAENEKTLADAQEWKEGVDAVRELIRAMVKLKELIWLGGLPFMASVFEDLNKRNLTKLVLDLHNHVRVVDEAHDGRYLIKLHINQEDMKPLLKQTRLQELRLRRLRDSMQLIAWKTVYMNELPGGMRTLELQMDVMPITRNGNSKWHKAADVRGLTVAQPGLLEKPYKGRDGKGGLHWKFGYGEYLDGDCIRKARIATGPEEPVPLQLQYLWLDGFVIDHLPFEHELTEINFLGCGEKCIDAGMRAPRTHAEPFLAWSKRVNHTACRFGLQWPNWTGIFDSEGEQRDVHGQVISQEAGLSTPFAEYAPSPPQQLPLTEKTLNLKDIGDALNNVSKPDYFNIPYPTPPLMPATPLGAISNLSERGSEVPTETALSSTTTEIPTIDGVDDVESSGPGLDSGASSPILHANGASDSTPEMSPMVFSCSSSFGSDGPALGHRVRKSLSDNYWVLGPS